VAKQNIFPALCAGPVPSQVAFTDFHLAKQHYKYSPGIVGISQLFAGVFVMPRLELCQIA